MIHTTVTAIAWNYFLFIYFFFDNDSFFWKSEKNTNQSWKLSNDVFWHKPNIKNVIYRKLFSLEYFSNALDWGSCFTIVFLLWIPSITLLVANQFHSKILKCFIQLSPRLFRFFLYFFASSIIIEPSEDSNFLLSFYQKQIWKLEFTKKKLFQLELLRNTVILNFY